MSTEHPLVHTLQRSNAVVKPFKSAGKSLVLTEDVASNVLLRVKIKMLLEIVAPFIDVAVQKFVKRAKLCGGRKYSRVLYIPSCIPAGKVLG